MAAVAIGLPALFGLVLLRSGPGHRPGPVQIEAIEAAQVFAVDGDTLDFRGERIRIMGVDTPEMRGRCADEIAGAKAAQVYVARLLSLGDVSIERHGTDKYGRTLARVFSRGQDIAGLIIAEGLGRAYFGGRRLPWCQP